jgi:hypothetical protein
LLKLITQKEADLELPEWLFDMDYPGHYLRRIKSISISIPNVSGANTTVSFMLSLQEAWVRKVSTGADYGEPNHNEPTRFICQTGGMQSICTSSAQNDSGMFELNFNDERYLPFENAGVISKWRMKFPGINQFDLSSVSDVILHINYTALYDGVLEGKAKIALQEKLPNAGAILFSPKQDFPDEWNKMDEHNLSMTFYVKTENLPFFLRGRDGIKIKNISVVLTSKEELGNIPFSFEKDNTHLASLNLSKSEQKNGDIFVYSGSIDELNIGSIGQWKVDFQNIQPDEIENIMIGFLLGNNNN